jgi:GntR family transcriptional regulator
MVEFTLNPSSGVPIYRQIQDQIRLRIASGLLRPGEQLPTVRALAVELSVNPNTVIKAYNELEREKVLTTEQGTGTFVAPPPPTGIPEELRKEKLEDLCLEFLALVSKYGFTHREVLRTLDALAERK